MNKYNFFLLQKGQNSLRLKSLKDGLQTSPFQKKMVFGPGSALKPSKAFIQKFYRNYSKTQKAYSYSLDERVIGPITQKTLRPLGSHRFIVWRLRTNLCSSPEKLIGKTFPFRVNLAPYFFQTLKTNLSGLNSLDLPFFNRSFDKKRLKNLFSWYYSNKGEAAAFSLIERVQKLGFHYAMKAGISLGVDDLKVPLTKGESLTAAVESLNSTKASVNSGNVTALEEFQQFVDIWHRTSETLKTSVIQNFTRNNPETVFTKPSASRQKINRFEVKRKTFDRQMEGTNTQALWTDLWKLKANPSEPGVQKTNSLNPTVSTSFRSIPSASLHQVADKSTILEERTVTTPRLEENREKDYLTPKSVILALKLKTNKAKNTDRSYGNPLNPVYMMAFSGARGNLSQVRQLVGMRGLMADPQGQLVEFPIQSNFREGLTVTEYMISCYGARKGLVDTALRTAAAGYLTRRLVDVSHHQIVRFVTCGTKNGILFPLSFKEKKASNPVTNLPSTWNVPLQNSSEKKDRGNLSRGKLNAKLTLCIGRVLARNIPGIAFRNQEIDISLASLPAMQKIYETVGIYVRSPLTCRAEKGICQLCYGWSVSANRLVGLGEAVGIIAAQSIGEPGTQLTMRTFHTGGVFSGDIMEECRAKHGGTVEFKTPYFGLMVRAAGGSIAFCIKTPGVLHIKTKDQISVYDLLPNSLLYVRQGEKVKAGSLLAQIPNLPEIEESSGEATKTIFSNFSGEVRQSRTFSTHLQNIKILASQKPPYMDFPTSTIFSSIYRAESFTGANSTLHSWQLEPSAPQANSENPFRYLRLAKEPGQNPGVLQAQSPLNPKFNPLASDLKGAFASVRLAEPRGAKTFRVNIIPGCHRFRQKPKGFQNINPKGFGANFVYSPVQIFDGGEKKGIGTGRSIKNLEGWDFSSPPNASIVKSNKVYSEKSKNSRLQTPDLKSGDGPKKLRYLTHFENSSPAGLKALEPFSSTENSFFLSLLRYRVCLNLSGNIYPKRLKRFRLLEEKTNKPDASFIKTSGLNKTFIKFLPNPKLYLPLYNSKYNQNSRLSQKLHGLNFYVKYYKKFQRSQSYVASPLTAKPLSKSLNFSLNSLALKKRNCYQPFSFFLSNLFYKVNRNKKKKLFVIFSTSLLENSFWWFGDQKLRLLGEQSSLEEVKKRVQRLQLDHGFCLRDGASLQEPNAPRVFGTPVKKLGLDQPESEIVFNPLDQTLNRVRERGENLQKLKRVEIKNYSYLFWKRSTLLFINSYNLPSRLTSKTYNKPLRFNLESGEFSRWFKGSEKKTRKKVEFDKSSKRRVLGPFTGALGPKVLYNAKTPLDPKHQVRFSSLRFKGANSQRTPQQAISKPTCAPARRSPLWRAASIRRKVNGLDQSFSQTFRVSPFLAERERFSRLPSLFPKIKKNPTARTFLTKKFFSQTAPFGFFQIFPNYQWYQKWRGIEPYNKTFAPLWRGEKTDFFPTKKNEKEKRFTFVYNFEPKVTGALEFFNLWLPSVAPFKPKTTTSLEKKTLTRDQTESLEISKFSLSPFNLSRLTFSTSARWPQKFLENCFSSSEDSFTKGFYLQPFWLLREDKGGYNFFTPSGFFNYKNLFSKVKSPRNTPIQKDGEIFPIQGNQKLQDFSQSYPSLPLSLKKTALLTYSDRVSYKTLFKKNQSSNFFRPGVGSFINIGDSLDENQNSAYCGQIIEKSFSSLTLRLTQNILYSNFPFRPARVNKELKKANWAAKGSSLVTLPYITSVTGDIVAGIPKIEQLFEARGEVLGETVEKIWSFYKSAFLSGAKAVRECYKEIGLFVVLSIQNVYLSQGVHIADKHLEVIIRQMTQRAVIIDPGDTSFLSDEFVDLHTIECVNWSTYGVRASYKPRLIGITKASLTSNSFLSSASFQQTARVLERETFLEKTDRLLGLKERVMIGAIINAGTGSLQTNVFLSKTNKKRSWKERGELSFFNKLDFFSRRKMNLFSKEGF